MSSRLGPVAAGEDGEEEEDVVVAR